MKRFYSIVAIEGTAEGWGITLDGRQLKTPRRARLSLPTAALAEAIAAEWRNQAEDIAPATMPMTGMANAALDLVLPDPAVFAAPLCAYGESDLLCYRAPEADLAARQAALWNPVLHWAECAFAVEFRLITGVIHAPQPEETIARLAAACQALALFRLAAMAPLVTIGGSLVAALALEAGAFAPEHLWGAVTLDEMWQEERWGADLEALAAREAKQREWQAAARFLALLATSPA